jgi:Mrp family chromosome partitioning ATPase
VEWRRNISPKTTPHADFAMSALDQAFIKAYAKDPAADSANVAAVASAPMRPNAVAVRRASGHQVEQVYRDGSLYRVETPRRALAAAAVPPPHAAMLPPTSPRRTVRRSMLRFLSNQAAAAPLELPPETPRRVARKVIIRHISHSSPPAPLGRLRATLTQSFDAAPTPTTAPPPAVELPPETIADEPPGAAPSPTLPLPATIAPIPSPPTAPLNVAVDEIPQFAVHGYWKQGEAVPATVVVADPGRLPEVGSAPLVTVSLDSLIAAEEAMRQHRAAERAAAAYEPAMARFAGKGLDDHDNAQATYRVDAEHAKSSHRPHARFRPDESPVPPAVSEPQVAASTPAATPVAAPEVEEPAYVEAEAIEETFHAAAADRDLMFAEAADETSPGDLTLLETEPNDEITPAGDEPAHSAAKEAAPLWELDRFQWPKTCQRLFADEHSYLAHAGGKLLAAVQDGLKVLAITGSRRGEGRSTLALCLARSAAQAGIQVAVMDVDFARPQLASKIGLEIAFGWQDAALGKVPLSEAAVKSLADNITVLPLETSAAGRSLSLADPRVTATVRAAAATFELLILDLGPIGPGEELVFPPGERCPLDAAIVVRDLRFATAAESEAIGRRLQDAGVEAVGIAENFVVDEELPATSV